ncbi:hypothetical protein MN608_02293 [Microdochium nivale]|nr:hypothetical protein MN608_02293 [Microdochium nivale]
MPLTGRDGSAIGQRRQHGLHPQLKAPSVSAIISCLLLLCCLTPYARAAPSLDDRTPELAEPQLLIDHGLPIFVDGHWQIMSEDEHLEINLLRPRRTVVSRSPDHDDAIARRGGNGDVTSTIQIPAPTISSKPATTKSATKTSSQTSTPASTAVVSPLPSPFDGALAANFSGACPGFIEAFLADPTFKSCYSLSLLLQGSKSFFNAQKSFVGVTRVLDATCAADVDMCTTYYEKLASDLVSDKACADDYKKGNSLVVQAYMGMRAYKTLYSASCLTDAATSAYCFAYAVTDTDLASSVYLYYMPLNITYPAMQKPVCNSCTKQTMGIFQAAAADRFSSIAYTYSNASLLVNQNCGAGYVNTTLPEPLSVKSDAGTLGQGSVTLCLLTTLLAIASSWFL